MSMAVASEKLEPSAQEVWGWVKKRFWYFVVFTSALNVIVVALGWPLLYYIQKDYLHGMFQSTSDESEKAKVAAASANVQSTEAEKTAAEAVKTIALMQSAVKALRTDTDAIKTRLSDYKQDAMENLPLLVSQIETAREALGDYKTVQAQIEGWHKEVTDLNESLAPYKLKCECRDYTFVSKPDAQPSQGTPLFLPTDDGQITPVPFEIGTFGKEVVAVWCVPMDYVDAVPYRYVIPEWTGNAVRLKATRTSTDW